MRRSSFFGVAFLSFIWAAYGLAQENWLTFRGPEARGVVGNQKIPVSWNSTDNILWKCDIPGRGWSSPIVVENNVIVTTVVNSSVNEEAKKGLYFGGDRSKPPQTSHRWQVLCLDSQTGRLKWQRDVKQGVPEYPIHIKNSYASETPVSDGTYVYAYFGNVGLFCFDLEGNEVWNKAISGNPMRAGWGTAASPILHEDKLFIVNDNETHSYVLALDKMTGLELWRKERDQKSNWATPYLWKNSLRTELVTSGTNGVRSYDLEGNDLWSLNGMSSITIATPYSVDDRLIISSGYVLDSKRPIYAIRPGATGDISISGDMTSNEFVIWTLPREAPYNPSTIAFQDQIYVLYDRGMIAGFHLKDGSKFLASQRIPDGRSFTASPWIVDGKLYCLNEDGTTFVFQLGDADAPLKLLATNSLQSDDMSLATPAIANSKLFLRTDKRIYCITEQ